MAVKTRMIRSCGTDSYNVTIMPMLQLRECLFLYLWQSVVFVLSVRDINLLALLSVTKILLLVPFSSVSCDKDEVQAAYVVNMVLNSRPTRINCLLRQACGRS